MLHVTFVRKLGILLEFVLLPEDFYFRLKGLVMPRPRRQVRGRLRTKDFL